MRWAALSGLSIDEFWNATKGELDIWYASYLAKRADEDSKYTMLAQQIAYQVFYDGKDKTKTTNKILNESNNTYFRNALAPAYNENRKISERNEKRKSDMKLKHLIAKVKKPIDSIAKHMRTLK